MRIKTLVSLLKGGKLPVLLFLKGTFTRFYRLAFLASMDDSALMERLSRGVVDARSLSGVENGSTDTADAWLHLGVRLGVLKKKRKGYALRGFLAKRLAAAENDSLRALVREAAQLHHYYILHTPEQITKGTPWEPAYHEKNYGDLIARSSRALEPFLFETIDRLFPREGTVRLLEVGCGHAGYIIYAAGRNPKLTAVGLDIDPGVADRARANVRASGLAERIMIESGDARNYQNSTSFDLLTLYNNIYYFPVEERVAFLSRLRTFLKPGGRIIATTGCLGGGIEFELVNLIHASTRGWGRLPEKKEMLRHMKEAGFSDCRSLNLAPGKYCAFTGINPEN